MRRYFILWVLVLCFSFCFCAEASTGSLEILINEKEANELKCFVEDKYGIKALAIKCDVSNEEQVKQLVARTIEEFGKIDVLVNNAGIVFDRGFEDITVEEFEKTLKVNVIGAFIVSREASKYMKKGSAIQCHLF